MSQPKRNVPAPDAATVDAALVAACRLRRLDRSQAFAGGNGARGVRILAGAALKARFGVAATVLAPLLKLASPELAPSMLKRYGVTTDDLLEMVEALGDIEGPSVPATPEVGPAPPVAVVVRPRPAPVPDPVRTALHPSAPPPGQPIKRRLPRASAPRSVAGQTTKSVSSPPVRAHVVSLKPMTPAITRWAGFFLTSPIWTAEEVADLFGVHPDAVIDAVAGRVAA